MQTLHTPGPWETSGDCIFGYHGEPSAASSVVVARIEDAEPSYESNRRLIAAAPEMLAALIEVQRAIACDRDGERYTHPIHGTLALEEVKYLIVDAAIELATGEEQ